MALLKWSGALSAQVVRSAVVVAPSASRVQVQTTIPRLVRSSLPNPSQVFSMSTSDLMPRRPIWQFVVNGFSSSGNLELEPNEDPRVAACEWVKAHLPAGTSTTIEAWYAGEGYWKKAFSFVTDAGFWQKDCASWAAVTTLKSGHLGQTTPPQNWTGVPEPPGWKEATGLDWPPTGAFPATPPPACSLLLPGTWPCSPWPPARPPGYPAELPWPLPLPPIPVTPAPLPPPAQTLPVPPAPTPAPSSSQGSSSAVPIVLAVLAVAAAAIFLTR